VKVEIYIPEDQEHCLGCGFLSEESKQRDGYCFFLHVALKTMEPCSSLWGRYDTRPRKAKGCPTNAALEKDRYSDDWTPESRIAADPEWDRNW